MIEIRTQEEFDKLHEQLNNLGTNGEYILIHELEDNQPYILNKTLKIYHSDVVIEGCGKSKPVIQWNGERDATMIEFGTDDLDVHIDTVTNCAIRNLYLNGFYSASRGIKSMSGIAVPTGTSMENSIPSTKGHYNDACNNNNVTGAFGLSIEDCYFYHLSIPIDLIYCGGCIIRRNVIQECTNGFTIRFSSDIIMTDNNIMDTVGFGLEIIAQDSKPGSFLICRNVISNCRSFGISLSQAMGALLSKNIIIECSEGIFFNTYSDCCLATECDTIRNNKSGIQVYNGCKNILVSDCTSVGNKQSGIDMFNNSENVLVYGNNVSDNSINGIFSNRCSNTSIVNNTSKGNTHFGIRETGSSRACLVFANESTDNREANLSIESPISMYNAKYN